MTTTIYADIYILVNLLLDYLALYLTSRLTGTRPIFWRLFCASLLGALWALACLYFPANIITAVLNIFVSLPICLIASKSDSLRAYIKYTLIFYITALILAGAFEAIRGVGYYSGKRAGLILFLLLFAAIYLLWRLFGHFVAARICEEHIDFDIIIKGRRIRVSGFVDSGNKLFEPILHSPVIIVKSHALRALPAPLYSMLSGSFGATDYGYADKIRVIPLCGASYKGIIYGFKPDGIKLYTKSRAYKKTDFTIAADFTEGDFSGYDAIIPSL